VGRRDVPEFGGRVLLEELGVEVLGLGLVACELGVAGRAEQRLAG
jgi:hypothetical protein